MEKDTRYNGWTNYETWLIKLWQDNEEASQNYWRSEAEEQWRLRDKPFDWEASLGPDLWMTPERRAGKRLEDILKDFYETQADEMLSGPAGFWHDLLGSALDKVNWQEIAEHWLEEIRDEERYQNQTA